MGEASQKEEKITKHKFDILMSSLDTREIFSVLFMFRK